MIEAHHFECRYIGLFNFDALVEIFNWGAAPMGLLRHHQGCSQL